MVVQLGEWEAGRREEVEVETAGMQIYTMSKWAFMKLVWGQV